MSKAVIINHNYNHMGPCFAYNSSLRFTRNAFGLIALTAFFLQSQFLVFTLGVFMAAAAVSLKYNVAYQFHYLFLRKFLKQPDEPIPKDSGELSFAWGLGASFLLVPSLLFVLGKYPNLGWALVLIDALLLLLAGIAGACVASIMYATIKKARGKK